MDSASVVYDQFGRPFEFRTDISGSGPREFVTEAIIMPAALPEVQFDFLAEDANVDALPEVDPTQDPFTTVFPGDKLPDAKLYARRESLVLSRPTLDNLLTIDHNELIHTDQDNTQQQPTTPTDLNESMASTVDQPPPDEEEHDNGKFGMWFGVMLPCMLSIFSVVLFLRLGWLVARAGIWYATLIIAISTTVTVLTIISLSAIASNGDIKGGGVYFMMSRSLGPEFGGAIGVIFSFGATVSVALNIVGFAEVITNFLNTQLTAGGAWDIRLIGVLSCFLCYVLVLIGVESVLKFQHGFLMALVSSICAFIVGSIITSDETKGITGYDATTLQDNFSPSWDGETFFSVFSVFFPAVTGIMTGASMSGVLKNPKKDIPKGELGAICTTSSTYLLLSWIIAFMTVRLAPNGEGTLKNYMIMLDMTAWRPLFYVGIIAASLSSALGNLVGAPRVFQAICADGIFPILSIFARTKGKKQEPVYAITLAFIIATCFILIGSLNTIATLITILFLASYGLVNYACFAASISRSPGWRPTFKYFHPAFSFCGGLLCLATMFLINWIISLIAISILVVIYYAIVIRKPPVNWGSAGHSMLYVDALEDSLEFQDIKENAKIFRPQFLVLTGDIKSREELARFFHQMKSKSLFIAANILIGEFSDFQNEWISSRNSNPLYRHAGLHAFVDYVVAQSFRRGVRSLLQISGLGGVRPNTLVMGYKSDWMNCSLDELDEYVGAIEDAFDSNFGVAIMRNYRGLEFERKIGTIDVWWLADDGGLTILLPHLLRLKSKWRLTKLRVLCPSGLPSDGNIFQSQMKQLMAKLRIKADVVIVTDPLFSGDTQTIDIIETPSNTRRRKPKSPMSNEKMRKFVGIGQVIRTYSSTSILTFITPPVPRRSTTSVQYLQILEELSKGLPHVIFVRGNQENVVTPFH